MTADTSKLELLLSEDRLDEARALIKEIVMAKLTPKEQASAFIDLAFAYVDVANSINRQYKAALERAVEGMDKVNRGERKALDNARVEAIREDLKK